MRGLSFAESPRAFPDAVADAALYRMDTERQADRRALVELGVEETVEPLYGAIEVGDLSAVAWLARDLSRFAAAITEASGHRLRRPGDDRCSDGGFLAPTP